MLHTRILIKKSVGFNKNIYNHGLFPYYNIRAYPLLGICYVDFRQIPCSCSECLSKMDSPWNISQDKYNKDKYKGENKNYVCWPILRSYNNWKIMHFIDIINQH